MDLLVAVEDPAADDVRALLEAHLAFCRAHSPPEHVHAMDVERLLEPGVTLFGARRDGTLLGVGALKMLDERHAEVKAMHTTEAARGQGVGRAVALHLLGVSADRGCQQVSLETGTMDAFAPARSLYANVGFQPGPPFAGYTANPYSTFMTLSVSRSPTAPASKD
jgi:putative acetyltransferase